MSDGVHVVPTDLGVRPPTTRASAARESPVPSVADQLAQVLAEVLGQDQISLDSHFFNDLSADSMVMARFCARLRKRADLPSPSIKDVYKNPTIGLLATALTTAEPSEPGQSTSAPVEQRQPVTTATTRQYVTCGALQFLAFCLYSLLFATILVYGDGWISAASGFLETWLRAVAFGSLGFVGLGALPIVAKWTLIGRWKPVQVPIWSLSYFRFWLVKTLVRTNPLALLFVGTPVYTLYLRALGAQIGRGVAIFSRFVPICTDLLTIGDGSVIRKDVFFTCCRARAGVIELGHVTLGRDAVVGESSVLDINTSIGDEAQLGHRSSLHAGQAVPAGERWHGSPGQPSSVDYRAVEPARCGTVRRAVFSVVHLLNVLVFLIPLAVGGVAMLYALLAKSSFVAELLRSGSTDGTSWTLWVEVLVLSFVVFLGLVSLLLLVSCAVPRLLRPLVQPGRVYPLYGIHYAAQRAITRLTTLKFMTYLFGDSSYVVPYLTGLGYRLKPVEQTGSNFGLRVLQDTPFLSSVGTGTMIADGLSIINAHYSSTSFRVARATIGPRNFLGNYVVYPSQGRTGDNCLLATKVMVPIDGEIREGVGLLGSPPFEIPRSVERDARFDHLKNGPALHDRLRQKNRYNLRTMGLFLVVRWLTLLGMVLIIAVGWGLVDRFGAFSVAISELALVLFTTAFTVLAERVMAGFRTLTPKLCSIYDPYFWWHERYWKLHSQPIFFNGTAFKGLVWRLAGVRIGRRVFDDGCVIPERSLVSIGDDCNLNQWTELQGHSQEDGTFKSDRIRIGARCTLGIGTLVHYGATIGDEVELAPESFLMKGEDVPSHASWGGNPAHELRSPSRPPTFTPERWTDRGAYQESLRTTSVLSGKASR